jgi:hypothetical protein
MGPNPAGWTNGAGSRPDTASWPTTLVKIGTLASRSKQLRSRPDLAEHHHGLFQALLPFEMPIVPRTVSGMSGR